MSQLNPSPKQEQKSRVIGSEHYHSTMKKEHPDWNFCPTCNASLREAKKTEIFGLFMTNSENSFVISISLSPDEGTGVISPFSTDGNSKFPVWAEPTQLGSQGLAKERLFEETVIQHVLPAFRNGFKIARWNTTEENMQIFSQVFMKYAQKDLAEQALRQSSVPSEVVQISSRKPMEKSTAFDSRDQISIPRDFGPGAQNDFRTPNMTSTGVLGFDRITNGGVPSNRITLLSGPSGLGKTIFGLQFLIDGGKKSERGVLGLTDHNPLEVIQEAEGLGIPLVKSLSEKKICLVVLDSKKTYEGRGLRIINTKSEADFLQTLIEVVRKSGAKRVVIDSLTSLVANYNSVEARKKVRELSEFLEQLPATVLATGFVPSGSKSHTFFGLEENFVSGLVILRSTSVRGSLIRYLFVPKMKGTDHNLQKFVYDIEPREGIRVLDPLKDVVNRRRDGSGDAIRDALQIANVLKSLAISNFSAAGFTQASLPSSVPSSNFSSSEGPAIERTEPVARNSTSGVSYFQPRLSSQQAKSSQQLNAKFKANNPKKVEQTEKKMPAAATDNPWTSVLSDRSNDDEIKTESK